MIDTPSMEGKRVVLSEDEGVTLLQLRKALRLHGLWVVGEVSGGREAIDVVLRERPDFVLMDVQLKDGVSGIQATEEILREFRTCIVMLTAFSDADTVQNAIDAGAAGYLVKPVTSESLLGVLQLALSHCPAHLPMRTNAVVSGTAPRIEPDPAPS